MNTKSFMKRFLALVLVFTMVLPSNLATLNVEAATDVMNWSATESNVLEVKDGVITTGETEGLPIYTAISTKFPATLAQSHITGSNYLGYIGGYKLVGSNTVYVGSDEVQPESIKFNETYTVYAYAYVKIGTTSTILGTVDKNEYVNQGTFTAKIYHIIGVNNVDSTIGSVKIYNANGTESTKFYNGDTVKIVVSVAGNYVPSVDGNKLTKDANGNYAYETTVTESKTYNVTYEEVAAETANVTYTEKHIAFDGTELTTGGGTVTSDYKTSTTYNVGTELSYVAKPEDGWYVKSIKVNGDEKVNDEAQPGTERSYTVKHTIADTNAVTVDVVFAQAQLVTKEGTLNVNYNTNFTTAEQMDDTATTEDDKTCLEYYIFQAMVDADTTIPSGLTYDKLTYEYLAENQEADKVKDEYKAVWSELDVVPEDAPGIWGIRDYPYYAFAADGLNSTEEIRVSYAGDEQYPALTATVTITLVEGRKEATISYTGSITCDKEEEVKDAIINSVAEDNSIDAKYVSVNRADGYEWPTDGITSDIIYNVTVSANGIYKETTGTVTVSVTNETHPIKILVGKSSNGETVKVTDAELNTEVAAGDFTVTVTPDWTTYYVTGIVVTDSTGKSTTYEAEDDGFSGKGVYTHTINLSSADDKVEEYTITATCASYDFTLKELADNATSYDVSYNLKKGEESAFKTALLTAVLDASFKVNEFEVGYVNPEVQYSDLMTGEEYEFTITRKVDDTDKFKLPVISKNVSVTISANPVDYTIQYTKPTDPLTTVENEDDIRTDAAEKVKELIIAANGTEEDGREVTVVIDDAYGSEIPIPNQGETVTVRYDVKISGNTVYNESTKTVEYDVIGIKKPAVVYVTKVGNGDVTVTHNGSPINTGAECYAGNLEITATPKDLYYVDSITVNEEVLDFEEFTSVENRGYTTKEYEIVDGKGLKLEEDVEYKIVIKFAEKKLVAKTELDTVGYNAALKVANQLDTVKKNIFNAVVDTGASLPAGIEWDDLTYEYYQVGKLSGNYTSSAIDLTKDNTGYNYFGERGVDVKEKVKLTWPGDERYPAVSIDAEITLVESRPTVDVKCGIKEVNDFDTLDDIKTAVTKAITATYAADSTAPENTTAVTAFDVEWKTKPSLTKDGEEQTAVLTVSGAGTVDYQSFTKDITVAVTGKVHPAKISVTTDGENHGTAVIKDSKDKEVGSTHLADELTITVTPDTDNGYYVESVTVNGDALEGTYDNCVFTGSFNIVNSDVNEDGTAKDSNYNVVVTYAKRVIEINDPISAVNYNAKADFNDEDVQSAFFDGVLKAVVKGITDADLAYYSVEFVDTDQTEPVVGEANSFRIIWMQAMENAKYPEVYIVQDVEVTDARSNATFTINNPGTEENPLEIPVKDENVLEQVVAAVKDNTTITSPSFTATEYEANVSFELAADQTVPAQGKDGVISVVITVKDNEKCLYTTETVDVHVVGKIYPAKFEVSQSGEGTVTLKQGDKDIAGGSAFKADGNYTIVADPGTTAGYVKSVKIYVNGSESGSEIGDDISCYADTVFTYSSEFANDTVYKVEVEFADRTLALNGYKELLVNGHSDKTKDSYIANLIPDKYVDYGNCEGGTKTSDQFTVKMNHKVIVGGSAWSTASEIASSINAGYGVGIFDAPPTTKNIKVVWSGDARYPEVESDPFEVKVLEERPAAEIVFNDPGVIEFNKVDEILPKVEAAVSSTAGAVTLELTSASAVENNDGVEQTLTYKATVAASTTTKGGSEDITVKVKGIVHPAVIKVTNGAQGTVAITDKDGNAVSGKHETGTLTVTAKPTTAGYYVESVAVNGKDITGSYKELTFTGTFDVVNGDYEAPSEYEVVVTYAKREIKVNDPKTEVTYNFKKTYEEQKDTFLENVYNAVVANKADGPTSVELVNAVEPVAGNNTFKITWAATDKYPEVSITETVTVTENRKPADIEVKDIEKLTVDGSLDAVVTAVEKATTIKQGPQDATFALADGMTAPKQGEEKTVQVVISVAANDVRLENTKTVDVTVVGEVHPATVTIKQTGTGTVTVKQGNEVVESGKTYFAGDLSIAADVTGANYVDQILVNGTPVNMTQTSGTLNFTAAYTIDDGEGKAANAAKNTYEIEVVFGKRTLELNDAPYEVGMNKELNPSEQIEELRAAIHDAVVKSVTPTGEYKVEAWNNGMDLPLIGVVGAGWVEVSDGLTDKTVLDLVFDDDTEKVRITYVENGKYPQVMTDEITINIVDSRPEAGLKDAEISVTTTDISTVDDTVKSYYLNSTNNPNGIPVEEITITRDETTPLPEEEAYGEDISLKYNVSFAGNETYMEDSAVITVTLSYMDPACTVVAGRNDFTKGSIAINGAPLASDSTGSIGVGDGKEVKVDVTPTEGNVVKSITVKAGSEEIETSAITYSKGVATVSFTADGSDGGKTYRLFVEYEDAAFVFNEERVVNFAGTKLPTNEEIYDAAVESPEYAFETSEEGNYEIGVKYLAREAGEYTIDIPKLAAYGITIYEGGPYTVELNELWMTPGEEIEEVDLYKEIEDIKVMVENVKGIEDATTVAAYVKGFLDRLPDMHIGAHAFGGNGDGSVEKITVSLTNDKYIIGETETDVTIKDLRIPTEIVGKDVTMVYGFTEEELYNAIGLDVVAEGASIGAKVEFATYVKGLDASETPYQIKVTYAGDDTYRPATKIINVTVNKAPSSIDFDSQVITYGDDYTFELVKNPENLDTIDFMIGLDMEAMSEDDLVPTGYIQLKLPGVLGSFFEKETTLSEFMEILNGLAGSSESVLEGLEISNDTVDKLITSLESVLTEFEEHGDMIVKINGEFKPDNVGVYIAGAVSADSNYETSYTVDYLVVVPDATEATLEYHFDDANGIITKNIIADGTYDFGATAFIDGVKNDEATAEVEHLFLKADTDGNITLNRVKGNDNLDPAVLSQTGAYTQLSYILDWGNELYYAMPISRAYVVVPQLVNVDIVDENGNSIESADFTFDGNGKEVYAVATDNSGNEMPKDNLKITYYGYSLNNPNEIYKSTEAPVDAGVYTALATYADLNAEAFGMDAIPLVIKSADASITVESRSVYYKDYDGTFGATVTPEDCKYITMIAGIDASGNFVADGLNAMTGAVNIDFPTRIDNVLKTVMPSAYESGISVNDILTQLDLAKERLAELGLDEAAINVIVDFLGQIPVSEAGDVKVTFHEYADAAPKNVGLYLLGAVTCDPNYAVDSDFGYLALIPDTIKVDLAFNVEDDNAIITSTYIKSGEYDLGSHVVRTGELDDAAYDEAESALTNLYIGANTDGTLYKSTKPSAEYGLYTQVAFILDSGNQIYYAEPISRTYLVVPEAVEVKFENDDPLRKFTFDGKAHGMSAEAFTRSGEALPAENLTVRYVGYDANDIAFYNSTEEPTNVGTYKVIATYVDKANEQYGMNIGQMIIAPAAASVTIDSRVVNYAEYDGSFGAVVTPEDCKYITMIAGVDASGNFLTEGLNAATGAVNIDFPDRIDNVLKKVFPAAYEDGISANEILLPLEEIQAQLTELGLDEATINVVIDYISQIPTSSLGDAKVTFHEYADAQPENIGLYILGAVTCDPNYELASDFGYLALVPETTKVGLAFNVDLEELFIPSTFIENGIIDLGVHVTAEDEETANDAAQYMTNLYLGVNAEDGTLYKSTAPSAEYGLYTQIAYILDSGNQIYYAEPIHREYVVVPELVNIHFADDKVECELTYNGYPQGMSAYAVDQLGNALPDDKLTLNYIGYDADGIEIYNSTTAPTNVGVYAVVATYIDSANEQYGMNIGKLTITPAQPTIEVGEMTVEYGDEYEFDITATGVEINGVKEDVNYITVVTGIMSDYTVNGVENAVNIDLPEAIDNLLIKIVPEAYENGLSLAELKNYEAEIKKVLEKAGFSASMIDMLLPMIGEKTATFADMPAAQPTEIGTYMVAAMALDTNYLSVAYDYALLSIVEKEEEPEVTEAQEVELTFDEEIPAEIEVGASHDFGVTGTVVETGEEIDAEYIDILFLGLTDDGEFYAEAEAPTVTGEYTQYASLINNEYYKAEEIERNFKIVSTEKEEIVLATEIKIDVPENAVYNGEAYGAEATIIDENGDKVAADVTYRYVGTRDGVLFYDSTEAPTEAGDYTVYVVFAGNENYEGSKAEATFSIAKAELSVTIEDAAKKVGEADPVFECKAKGIIGNDAVKLTLVREEGEEVGEYAITVEGCDNANYEVTKVEDGTLTIAKREITVTLLNASKTRLEADPEFNYTVSGDELIVGDTLVVTPSREEGEDAGEYKITANVEYNKDRYNVTVEDAVFVISEIERTETTIDVTLPENAVYNGNTHEAAAKLLDAAGKEFEGEITIIYIDKDGNESTEAPTEAGEYKVVVIFGGDDYHLAARVETTLVIKAKPVEIAIQSTGKVYGNEDPYYTYAATGIVEGETLDITITREAGEDVGTYVLSMTDASHAANPNYELTVTTGEFTITKRVIAVTMDAVTKVYGEADPELTYVVEGEVVAGDTFEVTPKRTEGEKVGTYTVTADVVYDDTNYTVSVKDSVLTISPKESMVNVTNNVDDWAEWEENLYTGEGKIAIVAIERENYYGVENEQPVIAGYLFSGWFEDIECKTVFKGSEGTRYAKFVDEKVLTVKAQTSVGIKTSDEGKMRIITSVDSADYANVGYSISINHGNAREVEMTTVYRKFYAVKQDGSRTYYTPDMISDLSKYFVAYTINGIPQYAHDYEFSITPYWTTLDGTRVVGDEHIRVISQMPGYY